MQHALTKWMAFLKMAHHPQKRWLRVSLGLLVVGGVMFVMNFILPNISSLGRNIGLAIGSVVAFEIMGVPGEKLARGWVITRSRLEHGFFVGLFVMLGAMAGDILQDILAPMLRSFGQ